MAIVTVMVYRWGQVGNQVGNPSSEHWLCVVGRPETREQIAPDVSYALLLEVHFLPVV